MVQGIMIQCDVCDEHFHVKYQMDETVRLYPWNLDFQCPECGDRIHLTLGALGKEVAHAIQDIPYKEFHKGKAQTRNEKISELENEQI